MNARIVLPSGNHIVLAQADSVGRARTTDGAVSAPATNGVVTRKQGGSPPTRTTGGSGGAGSSGDRNGSAGSVKLGVHPDLSGLPGAQQASQQGINVIGGLVFVALVVFALIGVVRIAVGNGLDLPDHSLGGKKMLLYAVPLAAVAAMLGQLVGWGWSLGGNACISHALIETLVVVMVMKVCVQGCSLQRQKQMLQLPKRGRTPYFRQLSKKEEDRVCGVYTSPTGRFFFYRDAN